VVNDAIAVIPFANLAGKIKLAPLFSVKVKTEVIKQWTLDSRY
jgi:hypothetical protein